MAGKVTGQGFASKDGQLFLQRCYKCGQENWAPAVASGQCTWCGYEMKKEDLEKQCPAK